MFKICPEMQLLLNVVFVICVMSLPKLLYVDTLIRTPHFIKEPLQWLVLELFHGYRWDMFNGCSVGACISLGMMMSNNQLSK
jgi:hypothetical protein